MLIMWNRIIRPDGVDIAIASPGIDPLGHAGMPGDVDSKYLEVFGNAALLSTLTVAFAEASDQITGSKGTQTATAANGTTTTSQTNTDAAVQEAVQNFSGVAKGFVDSYLQVRPTITVDQGTKVKVFVNHDLVFPPGALRQIKVLQ